jgi:basic membrane protein A and related proteins
MIFKEKEEKYLFILTIAIILVSGPLQLSSSTYAFYDINTTQKTTTPYELYEKNNSIIKDLKIALLTDGLFSDTGWGAFAYNAVHSLEINMVMILILKKM